MNPFLDTTWASAFVAVVVIYYVGLYLLSLVSSRIPPTQGQSGRRPLFVILIPAFNEENVIFHTLEKVLGLPYRDFIVILIDDASDDRTAEIAQTWAQRDGRLRVVTRALPNARKGKSESLNEGFRKLTAMYDNEPDLFAGFTTSDVLVGILDADGELDVETLDLVAPYFDSADTGQLQIGVKIANATTNTLTRLQDMEFVGFSSFVQVARDRIGSSGLGGNGQFTRFSALKELGRDPWTPGALTEDLDLGLALVELGWTTRFTNRCYVHQQGLSSWRPLMRQRTRWIQGHYQCWKYIPRLANNSRTRLMARLDLILYLFLVITVVLISFLALTGILGVLGVYHAHNEFLDVIASEPIRRLANGFLMLAPITIFLVTYQRHSDFPLAWWELAGFGFVFTIYSYAWILATCRAWARMITRRGNWVKTPREAAVS